VRAAADEQARVRDAARDHDIRARAERRRDRIRAEVRVARPPPAQRLGAGGLADADDPERRQPERARDAGRDRRAGSSGSPGSPGSLGSRGSGGSLRPAWRASRAPPAAAAPRRRTTTRGRTAQGDDAAAARADLGGRRVGAAVGAKGLAQSKPRRRPT